MNGEDEFDFSGTYVNIENTQDEDILTIVAKPVPEEKQSPTEKVLINGVLKPRTYQVLNVLIENNSAQKIYTIDNKTGVRFQEAWGRKISLWVGKQFRAKKENYKAFGSEKVRIAGYPLIVQKV
jgi:hypothetical protein